MEKKTDFKALSTKSKLQYIWDYYRWWIVLTVVCAVAVISLIHHYVTYREPALSIVMINSNHYDYSDTLPFHEFLEYAGIDPTENEVEFASTPFFTDGAAISSETYTDYEVLGVQIAAGDVDVFMGNGTVYMNYVNEGALLDLSTVLSAEVLAEYADRLIYSDADGTKEPYPCAIDFTGNDWLAEKDYYTDTFYAGIMSNSSRIDTAVKLLAFFMEND
jgi:hypothetical protein